MALLPVILMKVTSGKAAATTFVSSSKLSEVVKMTDAPSSTMNSTTSINVVSGESAGFKLSKESMVAPGIFSST